MRVDREVVGENGAKQSIGAANMKPDRSILGLDVIRFFAASLVMLFHFAYWFPYTCNCFAASSPWLIGVSWWGWIGVQIFFVISGFVIALSAERRTTAEFVRSRVLRLAPALWVFATLAWSVLIIWEGMDIGEASLLFAKSLILFPKGPWVDGVYWSLTLEVVFYGLIALLLANSAFVRLRLVVRAASAAGLFLAVAALAESSNLLPALLADAVRSMRDDYWSRYLLISTGSYFVLGVTLYLMRKEGLQRDLLAAAAASFIASEIFIYFWAVREIPAIATGANAALPGLVFACVVVAIAGMASDTGGRSSAVTPKARIFIRTLGLASYPLYLVHFVTGRMIYQTLILGGLSTSVAMAAAIAICIGISVAFAVFVEPPLRRYIARTYDGFVALICGLKAAGAERPPAPAE